MSRHARRPERHQRGGAFGGRRRTSWVGVALADSLTVTGLMMVAAAVVGVTDDIADSIRLAGLGALLILALSPVRLSVSRPHRATAGRILTGITTVWMALTLTGAVVYLATGTIERLDDALVESAAGFTTTALTTLDGGELSRPMVLFRAGTQWIGGLAAIVAGVVAMPEALRSSALLSSRSGESGRDLVPTPVKGEKRVLALYSGFTAIVSAAYVATGLGPTEAVTHALSTVSTGGWSPNGDSMSSFGSSTQAVAAVAMMIAGSSIFVIWWMVRGRLDPLWRSGELRLYVGLNVVVALVLMVDVDGLSIGHAFFTTASISSTTGFAVVEWTVWGDAAAGTLLVLGAIGAMIGGAGGGLRVARLRLLFAYSAREVRRQLDHNAIVAIKYGSEALDERALDRVAGYQIAYLVVGGAGSLALAAAGVSVLGAIWGAVSVVSTLGPAVGEIGPWGSLEALTAPGRLVMVPLMIVGRSSVLPALTLITWGLGSWRRSTRTVRRVTRRVAAPRRSRSGGHD